MEQGAWTAHCTGLWVNKYGLGHGAKGMVGALHQPQWLIKKLGAWGKEHGWRFALASALIKLHGAGSLGHGAGSFSAPCSRLYAPCFLLHALCSMPLYECFSKICYFLA